MNNFDKIEKYLLDKLSEEDKQAFEKEINLNPDLGAEVELQRLELQAIATMDKNALRNTLNSLREEVTMDISNKKKSDAINSDKRKYLIPLISIAASITIFLIIFNHFSNQYSNENLFQAAYKTEAPSFGIVRNDNTSTFDSKFVNILLGKNQTEANKAIQYFQTFNEEGNPLYSRAQLNLGHAYLLDQNFGQAASTFRRIQISTLSNNRTQQEAEYYRAIILLNIGKEEEATTLLNEIVASSGHRYQTSAKNILSKLNSFWRKF